MQSHIHKGILQACSWQTNLHRTAAFWAGNCTLGCAQTSLRTMSFSYTFICLLPLYVSHLNPGLRNMVISVFIRSEAFYHSSAVIRSTEVLTDVDSSTITGSFISRNISNIRHWLFTMSGRPVLGTACNLSIGPQTCPTRERLICYICNISLLISRHIRHIWEATNMEYPNQIKYWKYSFVFENSNVCTPLFKIREAHVSQYSWPACTHIFMCTPDWYVRFVHAIV